jgi:hypothetical protein
MNIEQRLTNLADRYRTLGYQVVVRPRPEDLPPFAKDFKVEILATRDDGSVVAVAKGSPSELEADPQVPRYAEVTNQQPGWRFDLFVLGPDSQPALGKREAKEPQEEEIRSDLDAVQHLLRVGFLEQSLVAAWAALEAAIRRRLRAEEEEAGWGTSPRTMLNELYSSGALSTRVLRDLEGLYQLRSTIVHGFSAPVVEPSSVLFLGDTARRLLTESQPAKQPA